MISYSKINVRVRLDAIRHNHRLLARAGENIIPVVKSDAYGHGLAEVSQTLARDGADSFAVGYVHEAVDLLRAGCSGRIISLLGPVDDDDYQALSGGNILPFIGHFHTLRALAEKTGGPLDIALKFDTGMSRLGFKPEQLPELIDFLKLHPRIRPVMLSSHLAVADEPERSHVTGEQHAVFSAVRDGLREAGYDVEANLANSAGTLGHAASLCDSQRVGIALYGGNPFEGTEWQELGRELQPAMEVTAPVLHVHSLHKGQGISYGHTYVADTEKTVAVVGAGYADCYSRTLSNRGAMNFNGKRVPILGRVCMQMTCVDVTGLNVHVGDEMHLLGGPGKGSIFPAELADWWGTITYEVFCLLGMNRRTYV